jgi:1,2-diacylglycerol 3-alpha-glucosyltransferase
MHVAIVYNFFPHYRAGILKELAASPNHHYQLVADRYTADSTIESWCSGDSGKLHETKSIYLGKILLYQTRVIGLSLQKNLDAIIYLGNPYYLTTWISATIARIAGKRVLFWTHGWTSIEHGPKDLVRSIFYRIPHALLLYGKRAKRIAISKGFKSESLYVIFNSLDYQQQKVVRERLLGADFHLIRKELFKCPDNPMVVCTARLIAECRFDLLIEAVKIMAEGGHKVNVLLIGDGPERKRLEALAKSYSLPVVFYGACYEEEVLAKYIMAANVTVSPGKVGLTAMHSLVYGTPVITHNDYDRQMPEFEAIVPRRTGDFFRCGDISDLAKVIAEWTQTELPAENVRKECYEIIENYYNPEYQRREIEKALRSDTPSIE